MAVGIPSTNQIVPFSTEALQYKTKQGLAGTLPGAFYLQYGASASYNTSTTETSILNNTSTTARGSLLIPANGLAWNNGYDPTGTTSSYGAGGGLQGLLKGTMTNTATPTIRIRVKMTNQSTGTAYYVLDTTALTTGTITGTANFTFEFGLAVSSWGTSGAVVADGRIFYNTATTTIANLEAPLLSTTLDTTAAYSIDILATWGTSSASNALIVYKALFNLI